MKLNTIVSSFLKEHSDPEKPLLLALSGGVDSFCLFRQLMENSSFYSTLHIAHIDHGWRSESFKEAEELQRLAEKFDCPFHLLRLEKERLKGNLEDACRNERISFFIKIAKAVKAQAVVLGHHADDQAETVLKRVFEGAPLLSLGGMKQILMREDVFFWRPFLKVRKSEVVKWMKTEEHKWFEDQTNKDPAYLRARMRTSLIPYLSQEFGKNITPSLCHLAHDSAEMRTYIEEAAKQFEPQKIKGPFGTCYDFSLNSPRAAVEWKFLIKDFCQKENFPISREKLSLAANLLQSGAAGKEIESSRKKFIIDRKKVFFLSQPAGHWELDVVGSSGLVRSDWTDVFRGEAAATVPKGGSLTENGSSILRSYWNKHKVPACIRRFAPVLMYSDKTIYDFLTGKSPKDGGERQNHTVLLKFKKLCC